MKLTLRDKENYIDNIWAFRFQPDEPLTWTPGQYVRVELSHDQPDSEGTKRWFTVSSAPYEGIVQITTRVTESTFKQALAHLPVGGQLDLLETPEGDFIWQETDMPRVFVAGGIGITPFRSILKQRAHDGKPLDVTLIYGGRNENLPFKNELEEWSQNDSSLHVQYVLGAPLTAEKLAELLPEINSSLVYVSGPEPMVETLGAALEAAGLPESQLKRDDFPNYNENNY